MRFYSFIVKWIEAAFYQATYAKVISSTIFLFFCECKYLSEFIVYIIDTDTWQPHLIFNVIVLLIVDYIDIYYFFVEQLSVMFVIWPHVCM